MRTGRSALALAEALVAAGILAAGLLPLLSLLANSTRGQVVADHHVRAGLWAREIFARLEALEFEDLMAARDDAARVPAFAPPPDLPAEAVLCVSTAGRAGSEGRPALLELSLKVRFAEGARPVVRAAAACEFHRFVADPAASLRDAPDA